MNLPHRSWVSGVIVVFPDQTHLLFSFFLNIVMYHHNLIKLIHYDETKKRAHDSQIVRAKEELKLSHSTPSQRQASGTNQQIKALRQYRHRV